VVFDLKTLKAIGEVKAGTNPDAIIYDLSTSRVFAFNGGSSDATVIDAAKGTVAGTVPLGGRPEFAASDGRGTVYV
jgi:YVTN family beta-propeller protein